MLIMFHRPSAFIIVLIFWECIFLERWLTCALVYPAFSNNRPIARSHGSNALRFATKFQTNSDGYSDTTTTTLSSSIPSTSYWTKEQVLEYADQQGVVISFTTLGPAYRAIARAKHNTTQIMGYIEGFVRPGNKILHLDKMEVFRKMIKLARVENPNEFKGGGTRLGVGLLLGYICILHGQEQGCIDAEFLAIDDEPFQHKRLVKFYRQSGFDFVKYVGDDFKSIPDRLIWGGCGTLLRKDIKFLLQYWKTVLEKSYKKAS